MSTEHAGATAVSAQDSTAAAILEVEEQMTVLSRQLQARVRKAALAIDPDLPPFGLKLLRLLARTGPTHASAAADLLDVDRSVISRQVKQLEELGLIALLVDKNDGRARYLVLTPLAEQRLAETVGTGHTLLHNALGSWEPADLHQFAAYIARLNSSGQ
ncbi:MAG: ArsR family transcriptional regulator [Glaciihabitans sp.]|nr:ArsR family transcriptional regulator [Glaciihabitans sp.]